MRVDLLSREYPPHIYGGAGSSRHRAGGRAQRGDTSTSCSRLRRRRATRQGVTATRRWGGKSAGTRPSVTFAHNLADGAGLLWADLVHSHTWYANTAGRIAQLTHGIPHVVSAHTLEPLRPWKAEQLGGGYRLSSWMEREAFENADGVIAVSKACAPTSFAVPVDRPVEGARRLQRHRRRRLEAAGRRGRRPCARDRPVASRRGVRRPDHPSEGAAVPAPRGGSLPRRSRSCSAPARRTPRRSSPRSPGCRGPPRAARAASSGSTGCSRTTRSSTS